MGCRPGAEVLAGPWAVPRPARCPRSSSAGTRAHSFFSRSAGSRFPASWHLGSRLRLGSGTWAHVSEPGALAAGQARLVPGSALRRHCGACGRHEAAQRKTREARAWGRRGRGRGSESGAW